MAAADVQQIQLWFSIVVLGFVAGIWAIYGGLSSVAWTDLFTVIVMIAGGITVTLLGLARWPARTAPWSTASPR